MEGTLFLKRGGNIEDVESYTTEEQKQEILTKWVAFYLADCQNLLIEDEPFEEKRGKGYSKRVKAENANTNSFGSKHHSNFKKGSLPKTYKVNRSSTRYKPTEGGCIW